MRIMKMTEYMLKRNHDNPSLEILPSVIYYGDLSALGRIYEKLGDKAVNDWMCENHGYYRAKRSGNERVIKAIEEKAKACPALLNIPDYKLIEDIHKGDLVVMRVAGELGRLQYLLPEVVTHIHVKASCQLSMAKQHGADLTAVVNGDTLLHGFASSEVMTGNYLSQTYPHFVQDYYQWVIEYLLLQGVSLTAENVDGQTPVQVAQQNGNQPFINAVNRLSTRRTLRMSLPEQLTAEDKVLQFAEKAVRRCTVQ